MALLVLGVVVGCLKRPFAILSEGDQTDSWSLEESDGGVTVDAACICLGDVDSLSQWRSIHATLLYDTSARKSCTADRGVRELSEGEEAAKIETVCALETLALPSRYSALMQAGIDMSAARLLKRASWASRMPRRGTRSSNRPLCRIQRQ